MLARGDSEIKNEHGYSGWLQVWDAITPGEVFSVYLKYADAALPQAVAHGFE